MYYGPTIYGAPCEATHNKFLDSWGFFIKFNSL